MRAAVSEAPASLAAGQNDPLGGFTAFQLASQAALALALPALPWLARQSEFLNQQNRDICLFRLRLG